MPSIVEPVLLTLDRERHLRFDMAALLLAEREMSRLWDRKVSLFSVLASGEGLGLNDISVLLWVSLLHDDPSMTLLKTQDLMDVNRIADYTTAIFAAWNRAWPQASPSEEERADPLATALTGDASGVPPVSSLASLTPSSGS